ncbi:MAG: TatD DNase family protein [Paraglaciecola sp.]|jgi:TatD DNase family protein
MLIDTHAHLYAEQFDEDRESMLERAKTSGVERFYLPNIDSTSIEGMLALEAKHPDTCFPMMGLHPCSVKENYEEELAIVEEWLFKREFCAVGEIGIDLHWDKTTLPQQVIAFQRQIGWAKKLDLPIIIHARDSTEEILEVLESEKSDNLRGIFHCFGGTVEEANRITDLGFYLGIGGVLTFKKSGLDKTMQEIDLKHIVLETDAPYLAPTPYRGKRNESSYIRLVAEKLAGVKNIPFMEVAAITSANAKKIFEKK